eukprot:6472827-Amphidinium_carterae.2
MAKSPRVYGRSIWSERRPHEVMLRDSAYQSLQVYQDLEGIRTRHEECCQSGDDGADGVATKEELEVSPSIRIRIEQNIATDRLP